MSIKSTTFVSDLERVSQVRTRAAHCLSEIAQTLQREELGGQNRSGRLELEREIIDLTVASQNLRSGVFRLLVLGDMKRGKSTFLNALMGENVLPSDVNPCTALLTVLRYGTDKQVTLHFNDGKPSKKLDFKTFKREYTISPDEAKHLEQNRQLAFPDIDCAVVEYPLPLLQQGVEIVDSPGLNDTEARNELSLGYINNCHAILFVLRATQPCTLGERRYLENYIKDRGLTVFFLINAWDQVRESLIDPDDAEELEESEYKLRRVFQSNLADYCRVDGYDIYDERVFEVSAIDALRRQVKDPNASLEGTGFPAFIDALNTFLTKERAVAELRQARTLARQASTRTSEAVARRLPLLDCDLDRLKQSIMAVEPEFQKLEEIRDRFQTEIRQTRDTQAQAIADSFRDYILNIEHTFESEFLRDRSDIRLFDFLIKGKREAFQQELQRAFEQYATDKISDWSRTAQRQMDDAFRTLAKSAEKYGASYTQVTEKITEKITGQSVRSHPQFTDEDSSPGWTRWAMGLFSLSTGNVAGFAMAGVGFDWKSILLNYFTVVGISGLLVTLFPALAITGPVGLALLGLGVGLFQADRARQELVKATQKELVKYLPEIAQQQRSVIYDGVKECFDAYDREVTQRITEDIHARKAELDNLVRQKEGHELDRAVEVERLQRLETEVNLEVAELETAYREFLAASDG